MHTHRSEALNIGGGIASIISARIAACSISA